MSTTKHNWAGVIEHVRGNRAVETKVQAARKSASAMATGTERVEELFAQKHFKNEFGIGPDPASQARALHRLALRIATRGPSTPPPVPRPAPSTPALATSTKPLLMRGIFVRD